MFYFEIRGFCDTAVFTQHEFITKSKSKGIHHLEERPHPLHEKIKNKKCRYLMLQLL